MKKIIFLILLSLAFTSNVFANSHKQQEQDRKQNRENQLYFDYQYLTHEERINLITKLYEEHMTLTKDYQDSKRINEIRNEIIWLLPNTLEEDVVKTAFSRDDFFGEAVYNALVKMYDNNGLRYNTNDKMMFGIFIEYIK